MPASDFGFTNDDAQMAAAVTWRDAAVADGWSIEPTYPGHEGIDRAARLKRDGYVCMILTRTNDTTKDKWHYEAQVHVWGPDGLALRPPKEYDMTAIREAAEKCHYCGASPVKTVRVGFAGRACEACQPGEEKKLGPRYYD